MRAYVGGTFDLFHPGHVRLFRALKERGYETVASLNTDEFAARYKRRPILTLHERVELVGACRYVDSVIVNRGDEDSRRAILDSRAAVVVHGDDWTGGPLMQQMGFDQQWLDEHGIELLHLPYTEGISTGEIIERIGDRHKP